MPMFKDLFGKTRRNRSALGFPDQAPDNRDSRKARPRSSPLGFAHDTSGQTRSPKGKPNLGDGTSGLIGFIRDLKKKPNLGDGTSGLIGFIRDLKKKPNPTDKTFGLIDFIRDFEEQRKSNFGDEVMRLLDAMQRPQDLTSLLDDKLGDAFLQTTNNQSDSVGNRKDLASDMLKLNETVYNSSGLLSIVGLRRFTELQGGATRSEIENLVRQSANGDLEATVQLLGENRVREIGIENLPGTATEISNLLEPDKTKALGFSPTQVLETAVKSQNAALGIGTGAETAGVESLVENTQTTDPNAPGYVPPKSPVNDQMFSNQALAQRIQQPLSELDQDDVLWYRSYADYWDTYDPQGFHLTDIARQAADDVEKRLGLDTEDTDTEDTEGEDTEGEDTEGEDTEDEEDAQTTDPDAPGYVPPRSDISDQEFSNEALHARIQQPLDELDQEDVIWYRRYADYWDTYDPQGDHLTDIARQAADDVEKRLGLGTEGEIDEDPFQTFINFFGEPVPISRGTIIHSEFEPGSSEEIAAKGGIALSDRSAEADRINAETPGLQMPPEVQDSRLTAAIRYASQSVAGNPFISVAGLARMRRGLMPLLNQINPQFWTRTSPSIVAGMEGLYRAVSVRAVDMAHIVKEFKPPSLRG